MKKHYQFLAKPTSLLQDAQSEALQLGLENLYIIQEVHQERWLLGGTTSHPLPEVLEHLELTSESQEVDWLHQSSLFSPYFSEGKIRIPLKEFSSSEATLVLEAGSGFGDLSHPTTKLVMQCMSDHVKNNDVLDIGCGSGILSLAASLMGARFVSGIDIDPGALLHAEQNKIATGLQNVHFSITPASELEKSDSCTALMNMTFLEQKAAWNSLALWQGKISKLIVSGILIEQKDKYLAWAKENNWKVLSESEEEEWTCFIFQR